MLVLRLGVDGSLYPSKGTASCPSTAPWEAFGAGNRQAPGAGDRLWGGETDRLLGRGDRQALSDCCYGELTSLSRNLKERWSDGETLDSSAECIKPGRLANESE
jgi:hypothetical protein